MFGINLSIPSMRDIINALDVHSNVSKQIITSIVEIKLYQCTHFSIILNLPNFQFYQLHLKAPLLHPNQPNPQTFQSNPEFHT